MQQERLKKEDREEREEAAVVAVGKEKKRREEVVVGVGGGGVRKGVRKGIIGGRRYESLSLFIDSTDILLFLLRHGPQHYTILQRVYAESKKRKMMMMAGNSNSNSNNVSTSPLPSPSSMMPTTSLPSLRATRMSVAYRLKVLIKYGFIQQCDETAMVEDSSSNSSSSSTRGRSLYYRITARGVFFLFAIQPHFISEFYERLIYHIQTLERLRETTSELIELASMLDELQQLSSQERLRYSREVYRRFLSIISKEQEEMGKEEEEGEEEDGSRGDYQP